jgi:hypothetical protein
MIQLKDSILVDGGVQVIIEDGHGIDLGTIVGVIGDHMDIILPILDIGSNVLKVLGVHLILTVILHSVCR